MCGSARPSWAFPAVTLYSGGSIAVICVRQWTDPCIPEWWWHGTLTHGLSWNCEITVTFKGANHSCNRNPETDLQSVFWRHHVLQPFAFCSLMPNLVLKQWKGCEHGSVFGCTVSVKPQIWECSMNSSRNLQLYLLSSSVVCGFNPAGVSR